MQPPQPTPYSASLYPYPPLFAVPQLYEASQTRPLPQAPPQPPLPQPTQVINEVSASEPPQSSARSNSDQAASVLSKGPQRPGGCSDECRVVIQGDQARDIEPNHLDTQLLDFLRDLSADDTSLAGVYYTAPFSYFNRRVFKGYRIKWSFRQSLPILVSDGPNEPQRTMRAVISVGDGSARLHPWMRGAVMPPSNEPEMRLLLMGENEPSFAFILLCTEQMFANIKAEQNLHVSFPAFAKWVVDLLTTVSTATHDPLDSESIATENESRFNVNLKVNENLGVLSIVKITPFRSLTHVSLSLQRLSCCQLRILLASEVVLRQRYSRVVEVHAASLLREAEDQRVGVENLRVQLSKQKEDFQSQRSELEANLDQRLKTTVQKCDETVERLRAEHLDTDTHFREADKERLELRRVVAELEMRMISQHEWENQRQELKETITKLTAEREALSLVAKREEEQSKKLVEVLNEKAELVERLSKFERDEKTVEGTLSELEEKNRHLGAWKTKAKDAQSQLTEAETTIKALRTELAAANVTISEAKLALERRHDQLRKLEKDLSDANDVAIATKADNQRLHNANMELNKRLTDSLVQMAKREQPEQFNSWAATGTTDGSTSFEPEDALFPELGGNAAPPRQAGGLGYGPPARLLSSAPLNPTQPPINPVRAAAATVGLTAPMPSSQGVGQGPLLNQYAFNPPLQSHLSKIPSHITAAGPPSQKVAGANGTLPSTQGSAGAPDSTAAAEPPKRNPGVSNSSGASSNSEFLTHVPPPTPVQTSNAKTSIARPRGVAGVNSTPVRGPPPPGRTSLPPVRPPVLSVTPPPQRQSQPVHPAPGQASFAVAKPNVRKRPSQPTNAFTIAQRGRTPASQPKYDDFTS